jgi:hypothetical protein
MVFKVSFRRDGKKLHDSGYAYIKNKQGNTYDVLTLDINDKNGNRVTTIAIDIEKDGWINLFSHYGLDIKQRRPEFGLFYECQLTEGVSSHD